MKLRERYRARDRAVFHFNALLAIETLVQEVLASDTKHWAELQDITVPSSVFIALRLLGSYSYHVVHAREQRLASNGRGGLRPQKPSEVRIFTGPKLITFEISSPHDVLINAKRSFTVLHSKTLINTVGYLTYKGYADHGVIEPIMFPPSLSECPLPKEPSEDN